MKLFWSKNTPLLIGFPSSSKKKSSLSLSTKGIWKADWIVKFPTPLTGLNLIAGAIDVKPDRAVPNSPSKEKTSNALLPPTTFDLNSKSRPILKLLFSETAKR